MSMLKLFNSLGKRIEKFRPANKNVVNIFTCGPSVYQRVHIGNFRTFLFEDILVRYLEYSGYSVQRGMTVTDIEDKAIEEAAKRKMGLRRLADENIGRFVKEMKLLRIKIPDFLPRASESIGETVDLIESLLSRKVAYRYGNNVYFDPLKFPGFGKLYGLDMSRWPSRKIRFHKDTYPGMRWNLGDFILWHGYREGDRYYWDTGIGRGRPAWNVQDPAMISRFFDESLSIYCGGIDNLVRHHDYTCAVLESVKPYPAATFWLHCRHLHVDGKKMSKSKGNIYYTDTLLKDGYSADEIRFFLIYGHYLRQLNFSLRTMDSAVGKLREFRNSVQKIQAKGRAREAVPCHVSRGLQSAFKNKMDDDLNVKAAFDELRDLLCGVKAEELKPGEALHVIQTLREIDEVLQVIF
jgi:cysteinyl-tRNA synthetase